MCFLIPVNWVKLDIYQYDDECDTLKYYAQKITAANRLLSLASSI